LFNSSERRLARLLLLLAHFGKEGVLEAALIGGEQHRQGVNALTCLDPIS
jgi:hypothetical protein